MSPRRYRTDRRKAAAAETRRRIVQATVDLHAEHGVMATTYAMVAERADVAVPTVYNHFPSRTELLGACTGQAAAFAPPLGPQIYDDAVDVEARLTALVNALFAYYSYYAPWLRWSLLEAQFIPELAEWIEELAVTRAELTRLAVTPAFAKAPPPALVTLCEILLDFPAWQRLTDAQNPAAAEAETVLTDALVALVRRQAGARPAPRRRSKSRTERKPK